MSLNTSLQNPDEIEFVHLLIDGRFYILDLRSDSCFYLHCDLYSYPDGIDQKRYHHKINMLNVKDDHNFQLILLNSDLELHFLWLLVLKAEVWFKMYGISNFQIYFPINIY